jgi:diguanylate cyclase (GGDEF)-like protein
MKFTLPKSKITPIIFFAIISIVISLILGLYQLNRISQFSYNEKMNTYDSLTENMVLLINQEIGNTYQSLKDSADLIGKAGDLSKEVIKDLLPVLADNKQYLNIAIVNEEGVGYDLAGNLVDASSQSYYIQAKKGVISVSNKIKEAGNHQPILTVAAPITNHGNYMGVLIADISPRISNLTPFRNEMEQGSLVYVLNANNDLILYMQETDIEQFDYNSIVHDGCFRYKKVKSRSLINLSEYLSVDENQETTYLWDKEKLGMNNWSVLIGRENKISPITKGILRLSGALWIYITLSMLLLFILIIIVQSRSNHKVIKMLYLDPVTGGDNWYRFRNTVNKILSGRQFGKKKYALINFDINRFKAINDAYGYQRGDEVLKEIYQAIKWWSRTGETFTRYSADQFYILMFFQEETEIAERINELNDRLHQLSCTTSAQISFGVYTITGRLESVDRMGQFANIAKDNNKKQSEGIINYFDDVARGRLIEEENIEKSMNEALKNNEFKVYLQPKYTAVGEEITGAEALVRWHNVEGNMISPGFFIPVFEKNGFITKLDYYMIKNVCALLRNWIDKGYSPMPISVNISRVHFSNPYLAKIICDIVDDYMVPHNLIELELTESAFLQNKQMLIETVVLLRSHGFLVSMDDFGAGYSSLNSLKDLPLDIVKLDGEMFCMTNNMERGRTVIRNTINMAKDLHMKVVAECIETKEQVEYLCKVGCDIIQGYYFAKPMTTNQFEQRYLIQSID